MSKKKNIFNVFLLFLLLHVIVWTLVPALSNVNLPLDTIEALAWSSNLQWGFLKHPPLSGFFVEVVHRLIGSQDWAYYLLSQLFIATSFFIIWIFSKDFFKNQTSRLISILLLEGIYFYNFTSPEFNVNVCQLPFWALSVLFVWRGIKNNKALDWLLFGFFAALGILSKYLFVYLLAVLAIFTFNIIIKNKAYIKSFLSFIPFFLILIPHLMWLVENKFITLTYALNRTGSGDQSFIDFFLHPSIFVIKQIGILIPFLILSSFLILKSKIKFNLKDKKLIFLLFINFGPLFLMFLTSLIMGVKIRTMWMTPFYLFFGVLLIYLISESIKISKIKNFYILFLFFFILSPTMYLYISLTETNKRTDYPGEEIARLVQSRWDKNFSNEISVIIGDEWSGGNLSYHLRSRPKWLNGLNRIKNEEIDGGVIYTGNSQILKKVCPGVYGTIKPIGICMIGTR